MLKWAIYWVLEPGTYKCKIPKDLHEPFPVELIKHSPQRPHTIQIGNGYYETVNDLVYAINEPCLKVFKIKV